VRLLFLEAEKSGYFFAFAAFGLAGASSGVTKPIGRFGDGAGGAMSTLCKALHNDPKPPVGQLKSRRSGPINVELTGATRRCPATS
jgi:hypothetical protein